MSRVLQHLQKPNELEDGPAASQMHPMDCADLRPVAWHRRKAVLSPALSEQWENKRLSGGSVVFPDHSVG